MFRSLLRRRARIETAEAFRGLLAAQGAFVAQRTAIEYCRVRAGLDWDKLFLEPPFRAAVEVCRWEAYAAVLGDLAVVAEGILRPHAEDGLPRLADALTDAVAWSLARYPVPEHRMPDGWGAETAALRRRLAAAQIAAPEPVHRIGTAAGDRIFEVLPIHPRLRGHDRELVRNAVRFALCRSYEEMIGQLVPAAVAADLLTAAPRGPAGEPACRPPPAAD